MDGSGFSQKPRHGSARGRQYARRALVAALGALALTAIVPALASAETEKPVWLENSKPITTKKGVEWKNARIAMLAESVPFGGRMGAVCEDFGRGYVEPGGLGIIEKFTISNCQNWVGAACGAPYSLEPKDLPWHTELGLNGKEPIDSLLGTTALNLGCYYNGSVSYDECKKIPPMRMANTTGENVLATFEEITPLRPCNFGASVGYIPNAGSMKIYLDAGGIKLGVS